MYVCIDVDLIALIMPRTHPPCAGAFVFTLIFVPETKGKSPAELLRWFNRGYAPADTEDV